MKKRVLSLALALALCLGLQVIPAQALTFEDAEVYLSKVKSISGSSYLIDFDGDGREELVFSKKEGYGGHEVEIWQGGKKLGTMTDYEQGSIGGDDLYFAYKGGKVYLVSYVYMYRDTAKDYAFYTVQNGAWVNTSNKSVNSNKWKPNLSGYTWEELVYTAKEHSVVSQLKSVAEPVAPPLPEVPSAPLGSGLTPAKAEAIEALKDVSYCGDRSAITMTDAQANAIINQMAYYASVTTNPSYPDAGPAVTYAALFDTGAGVPGLFMAKGYTHSTAPTPLVSGKTVYYSFGECAIWTFQNGQLALFSPNTYSINYTIYPACVEQYNGAPDNSYTELRYFAMNYGSLSTNPATTIVKTYNYDTGMESATVDGTRVTAAQAETFEKAWQGTGYRAYAQEGGGVEYIIYGMTPVEEMTAALRQFVAISTAPAKPMAYPSTQNVDVDGKTVEFQCYALKNEAGNLTNYIKLRDLASVLSGSGAKFNVGWDGAVNIETGKRYISNGSEMSTPFSGQRAYEPAMAETRINASPVALDAIVLKDDNGGAYTYYKLRDLGGALGFRVDWSAEKGISIETE